jgi:TolB-like protein
VEFPGGNPQERLTTALAGRYTVGRLVGTGGMASVYLAHDERHGRDVALKVLHPELTITIGAKRFLAEIAVTAKLQHPHILPLHDSGDAAGLLYYVMPYVDGESLRGRMQHDTPIGVDEAVRTATAILGAIDYAHRKGVVHRDLKPENVLLSDGVPMVADFGIARAVQAADSARITQTGLAMGTPAYMSPEQAAGEMEIDGRTDVYAVATILFELLAGRTPFIGKSIQAVIAHRFTSDAPRVREFRPDTPEHVDAAIAKSLEREPGGRFATAGEFVAALLGTVPVTGPAPRASTSRPAESDTAGITTLAVMPFANLSADPATEYFCDGMTDEIAGALSKLRGVRLASRTSTYAFKGKSTDLATVAAALKVGLVLEGTVRQAGQQVRVAAQLVDVTSGYQLWGEKFDRQMSDVFAMQDEIAGAITDALRVRLTAGDVMTPATVDRGTRNLDAYHLVLKGRHFWNTRALDKAMESFQQAATLDPNYAQAFSGLADGMAFLSYYGVIPPEAALTKGRAAAQRAVVSGPGYAESQYSLGLFEFIAGWDMDVARRALAKALEIDPRMGQAHATYAQWLGCFNRGADAKKSGDTALLLDPLSPLIHATVAYAAAFAGEPSRGLDVVRAGLHLDPRSVPCQWVHGALLLEQGDARAAVEVLREATALSPTARLVQALFGHALARAGRNDEARAIVAALDAAPAAGTVAPGVTAFILAALGDVDEAITRFESTADFHDPRMLLPLVLPLSGAEVRKHPRYQKVLEAQGLADMRDARGPLGR